MVHARPVHACGHHGHAGGFSGAAVAVVHARPVHACGHPCHAGGFRGAAVAVVHVGPVGDDQMHNWGGGHVN